MRACARRWRPRAFTASSDPRVARQRRVHGRRTATNDGGGEVSLVVSPTAASARAREKERVLLVGEGDFSFALALARRITARGARVLATSLESEDVIAQSWRGADNVAELAAMPGANIRHGVDATTLTTHFERGSFDRVVFNFPHVAGKAKMDRNRSLLGMFLREAKIVCAPNGFVEVSLAPGQGGTRADGERMREYGNSWQTYSRGAENGMLLVEATTFADEAWRAEGYQSRGHWRGLGDERGFVTDGGVVHVFCDEDRARALGLECDHCVPFTRDVSVWAAESAEDADSATAVREAFEGATGDADARVVSVERVDEWRDESTGRLSETFRVEYSSRTLALTRERVNGWNDAARLALGSRLRGQLKRGDGESF